MTPTRRRTSRPSPIFAHAAELWHTMTAEHRVIAEAQYAAAVEATSGNMLNTAARARGLSTWDVFTAAPAVVHAHASDELLDHLTRHPRLTLAAFERQWLEAHLERMTR